MIGFDHHKEEESKIRLGPSSFKLQYSVPALHCTPLEPSLAFLLSDSHQPYLNRSSPIIICVMAWMMDEFPDADTVLVFPLILAVVEA